MDEQAAPEPEVSADESAIAEASAPGSLPEELPPVEPPSASFIMQLFLVPAIIVAAVIGIWALFGQLSASEQDWRQLVTELSSGNEHRRWRGANGLAQMLRADIELGEDGQHLAANEQIADEFAALMSDLLDEKSRTDEHLQQLDFVTRTLSWLDTHESTIPGLVRATSSEYPEIIRVTAARSLSVIGGRAVEGGAPLSDPRITDALIDASKATEPLIRQACVYALGVFPGDASRQRLLTALEDPDSLVRVNAAIALGRFQDTAGVPELLGTLDDAMVRAEPSQMPGDNDQERRLNAQAEDAVKTLIAGNALPMLIQLKTELTEQQRSDARSRAAKLADGHPEIKIRLEAQRAVRELAEP